MTRRYMKFLQQNILMRLRTDKSTLLLEKRGEACMCKHWECPYRYCPYHKNFSQELLDSAREVIPNTVKSVIPDIEWGQTPENCQSYLDR